MKRLLLLLPVLCLLAASDAHAQIEVRIGLPTIRFEAPPPLVVIQPGIRVVPDQDDEVFFVDDYYWVRRGPTWYRTRDHRGGWTVVERDVPRGLVRMKPGRYHRYHGGSEMVRPAVVRPVPSIPAPRYEGGDDDHDRGHGKEKHGGGHGHGHGH
jgi:hypothetical protein